MGYDDRFDRWPDDEAPPRRPSRPRDERGDGAPRSGSPSRPRPRDDAPMPSRRSRPRDDDAPPPARLSRPRPDDRSQPPPRVSRPRDDADDAPPLSRRARREPLGRADSSGAREMLRRVRDRMANAYDSMSGWLSRAEPRRSPRRDRRASYDDSAAWSWDDASGEIAPANASPRRSPPEKPLTLPAPPKSLARTLINRRRKLRRTPLGAAGVVAVTILTLIVIVGGGFGAGYAYAETQQNDQRIIDLGLSRDLQSSRIFDRNGRMLYQTFGQTDSIRDYLDYCEIPPIVKVATVDTEDNTFWSDPGGINVSGLLRAIEVDLSHSGGTQGGSGITQQLVKLEVLGDSSQNLGRKIDEAILATDVTRHYSRQDILTMYLNIIPYGFVYEGIEAAAQNYFQILPKDVSLKTHDPAERAFLNNYLACMHDRGEQIPKKISMSAAYQLQPWQALLLAGVPNNPTVYNPYYAPKAATYRLHDGVLLSMVHNGDAADITINGQQVSPDQMSAYVLTQITHLDPKGDKDRIFANQFQKSANAQSQELAPFFVDYVIQKLSAMFPNGREGFATAGWNVYTTLDYGDPSISDADLGRIHINKDTGQLDADHYNAKKEGDWLQRVGLQQYAEFVARRDIRYDFPDDWYCNKVPLAHPDYQRGFGYPADNPAAPEESCWETPLNGPDTNVHDAALTAIDPRNGDILAMVGGVDYSGQEDTARSGGQFNVAISDQRSMGSSFKPIVYATAMQMGWNPGTVIRDQPTCFPAPSSGEAHLADGLLCPGHYMPHNDEFWHWAGPEPLRILLGNSLNTPAELALSFVGLQGNDSPLMSMARRLGITTLSADNGNLNYATAIGTQPVPLLQLTSAYGTFANQGYHVPPRYALSIVRADGQVILPYNPHPAGWQALSAQSAFMVTSMLDDNESRVADFGPDNPLHFYNRDVAAKTGTSDAEKDIVTMGYTPWLSLGVWAGNANSEPAKNIIGIAGAGYIFHDVMAFAIDRLHMPGTPPSRFVTAQSGGYFPVPPLMHRAILNCNTGLAPWKGMDVLSAKSYCDPRDKDRVAPMLTTEFLYEFGKCARGQVPPIYPNEKWNCGGDKTSDKQLDEWENMDWGNEKNGITTPGIDVSWVIDGQDPLAW